MTRRPWTVAEDAQLRARYPHERTAALAEALGRSCGAVYLRADVLGLKKSAAYLASPAACRTNGRQGVGTRFKPGQVPPNKGLRRPGWGPGRMKASQFKKGESRNAMPVGSTRLIEGYVYRKVSDIPHQPYTTNWKLEHWLVWTAAHGAVPPGYAVVFKDGNREHCVLGNLELISRADLMRRNTVHNLPKPVAQVIQLMGAVTRQIRRRERHAAHD